jgi:hypothetical protein
MTTTPDPVTAAIHAAGLGPTTSVDSLIVDDVHVLKVLLAEGPQLVTVLRRWLDRLTVHDMVVGKFRASDTVLRLTIRGQGGPGLVCVSAPFSEHTQPAQVELIATSIDWQQPRDLVDQLAALETRA